jgi:hypothetical protein
MLMNTAAKTLARIDGLIRLRQGKHLYSIGLPTERNIKRECVGSSLCNQIPRNKVLNFDNNVHAGRVWSLRKARAGRSSQTMENVGTPPNRTRVPAADSTIRRYGWGQDCRRRGRYLIIRLSTPQDYGCFLVTILVENAFNTQEGKAL